jgi:hypothetical protein
MDTVTSRIYRFVAETQEAAAQQTEVQTKSSNYAVVLSGTGNATLSYYSRFQSSHYKGAAGLLESQGKTIGNRYRPHIIQSGRNSMSLRNAPVVQNVYRSDGKRT